MKDGRLHWCGIWPNVWNVNKETWTTRGYTLSPCLFPSFTPFIFASWLFFALCVAWIPSWPSPHLPHKYGVYLFSRNDSTSCTNQACACLDLKLESRYDGAILIICLPLHCAVSDNRSTTEGDGLPTFALEAKCFHWCLTSFHLPGLHITPSSFCTKRYFCPNSA